MSQVQTLKLRQKTSTVCVTVLVKKSICSPQKIQRVVPGFSLHLFNIIQFFFHILSALSTLQKLKPGLQNAVIVKSSCSLQKVVDQEAFSLILEREKKKQ